MPTVDKDIADRIVKNDGYYTPVSEYDGPDNPLHSEITEYDNAFGGVSYGLTVSGVPNVYTPSKYVRNPRCYWKLKE
jgi:hypothetical protein